MVITASRAASVVLLLALDAEPPPPSPHSMRRRAHRSFPVGPRLSGLEGVTGEMMPPLAL
jgi:hypothetical protein